VEHFNVRKFLERALENLFEKRFSRKIAQIFKQGDFHGAQYKPARLMIHAEQRVQRVAIFYNT
jgi:hypothetical protein